MITKCSTGSLSLSISPLKNCFLPSPVFRLTHGFARAFECSLYLPSCTRVKDARRKNALSVAKVRKGANFSLFMPLTSIGDTVLKIPINLGSFRSGYNFGPLWNSRMHFRISDRFNFPSEKSVFGILTCCVVEWCSQFHPSGEFPDDG